MNEDILKLPSVAVLVDCWEKADAHGLYDNIINFLNTTPEITAIILATYDSNDLNVVTTNIWYKNALNIIESKERTLPKLLNYVNPNKLQVAMHSFDDFSNFLSRYTGIKNIYFMGHSWNQCIHDRPIGIFSCLGIDKNIIINQSCIWNIGTEDLLNVEKDRVNERIVKLKDNIYQIFSNNPAIDS